MPEQIFNPQLHWKGKTLDRDTNHPLADKVAWLVEGGCWLVGGAWLVVGTEGGWLMEGRGGWSAGWRRAVVTNGHEIYWKLT